MKTQSTTHSQPLSITEEDTFSRVEHLGANRMVLLYRNNEITPTDFMVLYCLSTKINPSNCLIDYSIKMLAEWLGLKPATIKQSFKRLIDAGLLFYVVKPGGAIEHLAIDPYTFSAGSKKARGYCLRLIKDQLGENDIQY